MMLFRKWMAGDPDDEASNPVTAASVQNFVEQRNPGRAKQHNMGGLFLCFL